MEGEPFAAIPQPLSLWRNAEPLVFIHHFSGYRQGGLGEAVRREAALHRIRVLNIDRDWCLGHDLLDDSAQAPYVLDIKLAAAGKVQGYHTGWVCSSFSRIRFLPGGPPPVRDRSHLTGLPSNNAAQQAEADRGTNMVERSIKMMRAVVLGGSKVGYASTSTCENPEDPGVEPYPSAWIMPCVVELAAEGAHETASFPLCAYGPRHAKQQRFQGNLPKLASLSKKCTCLRKHIPLRGNKAALRAAARYPPALCQAYARLWVAHVCSYIDLILPSKGDGCDTRVYLGTYRILLRG